MKERKRSRGAPLFLRRVLTAGFWRLGSDAEVAEVDAFGGSGSVAGAHSHPYVDAVAAPDGGEGHSSLTVFAFAGVESVDGLTFGGVVDEEHSVVGAGGEADAAVVGPGDVEALAVDDGAGAVGKLEEAFGDEELVVEELVGGVDAADDVVDVGLDGFSEPVS